MPTATTGPVVVKVGGALLECADCIRKLWGQVARLQNDGLVIVVHGGGSQATSLARRLGHEPRIIHGRRVTTDADLEIVKAAFGIANMELVAAGLAAGVSAVGLTGVDGASLLVERRPPREIDGETVDFGWVGEVLEYRPSLVTALGRADHVPVVAPLGVDDAGLIYNVNADTVASEIARALNASALLLVTESGGVRRDAADADTLMQECSEADFEEGVSEGWISAGMRAKLEVALAAAARTSADVFVAGYDDLIERDRSTRVVAASKKN